MHLDTLLLVAVVVVLVTAWRLTYTAARLDRLHARVEGSLASLDAQLVRRAEVALEVGGSGLCDPATSFLLIAAAGASIEAADDVHVGDEVRACGLSHHRVEVESELTDAVRAVVADWPSGPGAPELRRRLADACLRVELAQRFHNEAVRDVRRVRAVWFVRLFHLAGHTALPQQIAFDDRVPGLDGVRSTW